MAMSPLTVFGFQPYFSYSPSPSFPEILEEGHTEELHAAAKALDVVKPTAVFKGAAAASQSSTRISCIAVGDVDHTYAKTVNKTIKAWKEYVEDRVGHSRAAVSTFFEQYQGRMDEMMPENHTAYVHHGILRRHLDEDIKAKEAYKEVINRISSDLDDIAKQTAKVAVRVLFDREENIQAMASFSLKDDHLYVNLLATAPSNLRLHGINIESHRPFKGGGTILLHSLYITAQQKRLPKLSLSPLDGSVSFYKHIGMKQDPATEETHETFSFDVLKGRLPSEFQTQFKKLCLDLVTS